MSVRLSLLCALFAVGAAQSGFSQDSGQEAFAPEMGGIDQFKFVWEKSPFVRKSEVVKDSQGLAQQYSLAAIAQINNEAKVFLIERNSLKRIMIPSENESLQLVSVSMDRDLTKSSAVIKRGDEQASITYDNNLLAQTPSAAVNPAAQAAQAAMAAAQNLTAPRTVIPPPPNRVIKPPGVPVSPDEDDDKPSAPSPARSFLRKVPIKTQN